MKDDQNIRDLCKHFYFVVGHNDGHNLRHKNDIEENIYGHFCINFIVIVVVVVVLVIGIVVVWGKQIATIAIGSRSKENHLIII